MNQYYCNQYYCNRLNNLRNEYVCMVGMFCFPVTYYKLRSDSKQLKYILSYTARTTNSDANQR